MRSMFAFGASLAALAAAMPALAQQSNSTTAAQPAAQETAQTNAVAPAQQPASNAEGGDIIVTAQRRSEKLQDVPIAIAALNEQTLQRRRVLDLNDLSNVAPSLQIKGDDNGANPRIFIRGVGVNDFNPATNSAVGIYSDGVYVASPLAQRLAFFDLNQVEVLRGPQGTLYGRNTTGGAINVNSKLPGNDYGADLTAEYGNFDSVNVQGGVSIPIIPDKLSIRVAGLYQRDDGYTINRLTGDRGNNTNRWSGRGVVHFTPTDRITDNLIVSGGKSRGGSILAYARTLFPATADAAGADGLCSPAYYTSGQCTNILGYANTSTDLYKGDYRFEGKDKVNLFTVSNSLTIDLGGASVVSVTGYQHADRDDVEETDANPLEIIDGRYRATQNTFSQELRLQSNGNTPLRYVVGVYYAHDFLVNNSYYNVLPGFVSDDPDQNLALGVGVYAWPLKQRSNSYAAFGQVDYNLTSKLIVTGGLRYSADQKAFHYVSEANFLSTPIFTYDNDKTFSSVSGKAGLQYKFSTNANVYASYNRGTKSGGFFSGQTADIGQVQPYKDETVNAYEVGAKTELLHRTLRANVSAFYYDYQNLQVYTTQIDGLITRQIFTNASAATIYGAELELEARPVPELTAGLNLSYLHARYRDFRSAGADYSGNHLPSAPSISIQQSLNWEHPLGFGTFVASEDLSFRSKVYFDTANTPRLTDQPRAYLDARVGVRFDRDRYEVGVWGKNLANETNISDITSIESLGFDIFSVGPPRTYGLYLKARL